MLYYIYILLDLNGSALCVKQFNCEVVPLKETLQRLVVSKEKNILSVSADTQDFSERKSGIAPSIT